MHFLFFRWWVCWVVWVVQHRYDCAAKYPVCWISWLNLSIWKRKTKTRTSVPEALLFSKYLYNRLQCEFQTQCSGVFAPILLAKNHRRIPFACPPPPSPPLPPPPPPPRTALPSYTSTIGPSITFLALNATSADLELEKVLQKMHDTLSFSSDIPSSCLSLLVSSQYIHTFFCLCSYIYVFFDVFPLE